MIKSTHTYLLFAISVVAAAVVSAAAVVTAGRDGRGEWGVVSHGSQRNMLMVVRLGPFPPAAFPVPSAEHGKTPVSHCGPPIHSTRRGCSTLREGEQSKEISMPSVEHGKTPVPAMIILTGFCNSKYTIPICSALLAHWLLSRAFPSFSAE